MAAIRERGRVREPEGGGTAVDGSSFEDGDGVVPLEVEREAGRSRDEKVCRNVAGTCRSVAGLAEQGYLGTAASFQHRDQHRLHGFLFWTGNSDRGLLFGAAHFLFGSPAGGGLAAGESRLPGPGRNEFTTERSRLAWPPGLRSFTSSFSTPAKRAQGVFRDMESWWTSSARSDRSQARLHEPFIGALTRAPPLKSCASLSVDQLTRPRDSVRDDKVAVLLRGRD
jgi:hypothetical protein